MPGGAAGWTTGVLEDAGETLRALLPPKITTDQAKGFSLTMGKMVLLEDAYEVAQNAEPGLRNAAGVSL